MGRARGGKTQDLDRKIGPSFCAEIFPGDFCGRPEVRPGHTSNPARAPLSGIPALFRARVILEAWTPLQGVMARL